MASPCDEWVDVDADSTGSGWEPLGESASSSGSAVADLDWTEAVALRQLLGAATLRATEAEAKLANAEAELAQKAAEAAAAAAARVDLEVQVRTLQGEVGALRLRLEGSGQIRPGQQQLLPALGGDSGGCRQSQRAARRSEQKKLQRSLRQQQRLGGGKQLRPPSETARNRQTRARESNGRNHPTKRAQCRF